MRQLKSLLFITFSCLFSIQISAQKETSNIAKSAIQTVDSLSIKLSSLTIEESEENDSKVGFFGTFLEASINDNKPKAFLTRMDKESFAKFITKDDDTLNEDKDSKLFRKGFVKGLLNRMDEYPKKIAAEVQKDSYYSFISYRYDSLTMTYYALFRLFSIEGGVNYHDYRLSLVDGKFKFSDVYIYLSGEHLSQTFSRMYTLGKPKKKMLGLFNVKKYSAFDELSKALSIYHFGGYKKAYNIIENIEDDITKAKFLLIIKSEIASHISDELYTASLEELKNRFPNDPTIYLTQIDYHIYKKEYYEAIDLLDKLQNETQDDFLYYLKANIALEDKNYDVALDYYNYIITNYPGFVEGYVGVLTTYVSRKEFPNAIEVLDTIINEGYDKKELINFVEEKDELGFNILEPLMKEKVYKKWKRKKS